jgi:nitroimidazol reductase NimA-like FMN-containing flavoprotein (pyridoxamine 5'-phosphate oxidase superfamily)
MVVHTGVWDESEVAAFLADAVVPVRLAVRTPGGPLWMLSLWFVHREGSLWCATSADADVVRYLEGDDGVAFEVSTNDPPYRGVRGNGTATVLPDGEALLRDLLERYLGGTGSPLARRLLDPSREEVQIRVDPRRIHSWDYSDRMREAVEDGADGGECDGAG